MSLASLTIDLTANLSAFESDMGRAGQIATRAGDQMARAAASAAAAIAKQADQVGRTQTEYLALQAAQAGLGDSAQRFLDIIAKSGAATATATAKAAFSISSAADAAQSAADRQRESNVELVKSILQVNDAYAKQRAALIASQAAGQITPDQLKSGLSNLNAGRTDAVSQLKQASAAQAAQAEVEAAEAASIARRAAAFAALTATVEKLNYAQAQQQIDEANQVAVAEQAALDKRAAAFNVLVQKVTQANFAATQTQATAAQAAADAEAAILAKRGVAFDALAQKVAKANYQDAGQQATAAQAAADAEAAGIAKRVAAFDLLRQAVAKVNYADQQKAEEAYAAAELASTAKRTAAVQALIDKLNGVSDVYQKNVALLDTSLSKGEITPQTYNTARTNLDQQQNPQVIQEQQAAAALAASDAAVAAAEQKKAAAAQASADSFVASVNRQADAIGKTRTQLLQLQAEELGVGDATAAAISKLTAFDAATGQLGKSAYGTRNQLLTLHYTLSDVIASLASGISPFTILAQQGGQVYDAFNQSFSQLGKTLLSVLTPTRLAIGALGGAVGALAVAFYEGSVQTKAFKDAVTNSGSFAGQTAGQFTDLARTIATSTKTSVSSVRDFGLALIQTGQIGPQVFAQATQAAVLYGQETGKTAKDVQADFAAMATDATAFALSANKASNILTAAQVQQVRALQNAGQDVAATSVIYEAIIERGTKLQQNLGSLQTVLQASTNLWHQFWDSALDVGREQTTEQKITAARQALANAGNIGTERVSQTQLDPERRAQLATSTSQGTGPTAQAQEYLKLLNLQQQAEQGNADADAALAKLNQKAGESQTFTQGFLERAKAAEGLANALAKAAAGYAAEDELAKKDSTFVPTSAATRAAVVKELNKQYTDKEGVNQADAERKAQLAQDIKFAQEAFAAEKQALSDNQAQLQALYNAGEVSLQTYYDQKNKNIKDGVTAELNQLIDEQARLEVELAKGNFKDPAEKTQVQTQLAAVVAQQAKVQQAASQATIIANTEQAESFRQLNDKVLDFQASLATLSGDEATAAQLRSKVAASNVQKQAVQAGSLISFEDVENYNKLTAAANAFADVQRKVSESTARESTLEGSFNQRALEDGYTLEQQESGIYLIRSAQLSQLGDLRDKAAALAAVSNDPKVLQFASDLALQYEKAADAVDPALTRIRDAGKDLADGLATDISNVTLKFTSFQDLVKSVGQTIEATVTKYFVQAPLQQAFEGYARQFLNNFSGIGSAGNGVDGAGGAALQEGAYPTSIIGAASAAATADAAQAASTAASTAATGAMTVLTAAANAAADALLTVASSSGAGGSFAGLGLAGLQSSPGAGVSEVGGINAGLPAYGLATGTDYVPYDNFPALLHKGERVTPAKYNPLAAGSTSGSGLTVNVHPASDQVQSVQKSEDGQTLDIVMQKTEARIAGNYAQGRSPLNRAMTARGIQQNRGLAKRG